ncbi:MAG: TetR/AcrR family transcriptional regulator [Actinobacteria bacterium]|nr:TetR/AcrR family transcriptional regulator [Actinomycetota bacterium]
MAVEPEAGQRLITSAKELFHVRSYGSVGVQELCEHAGVRRGSFYYYFPSKRALVLAVLDDEWQSIRDEVLEPSFSLETPPLERFQRYIDLVYAFYRARTAREGGVFGGCALANLGQEICGLDSLTLEKVSELLDRTTSYYRRAFEDAIESGDLVDIDPQTAAERVRVYVQGLLELAKFRNDPEVILRLSIDPRMLAVTATR